MNFYPFAVVRACRFHPVRRSRASGWLPRGLAWRVTIAAEVRRRPLRDRAAVNVRPAYPARRRRPPRRPGRDARRAGAATVEAKSR